MRDGQVDRCGWEEETKESVGNKMQGPRCRGDVAQEGDM
jgi:hypothetical protein